MRSIASFFILLVFASSAAAQNPDGKNVSLHLTPVWTWGNADFQRITSVWYPASFSSNEQSVRSSNYGTLNYPLAFGLSTQLRIPAASFLTVSLRYSYDQLFQEEDKNIAQGRYFSEYYSINGALQTVSATISIYNLFSVYTGE